MISTLTLCTSRALVTLRALLILAIVLIASWALTRGSVDANAISDSDLPPGVYTLDKKIACRGSKAGKVVKVKKKGVVSYSFLTLNKFYIKKNGGGALSASQKQSVKKENLRCKQFNTIETLFVDTGLKKNCKGNKYSTETRGCTGKSGQGFKSIKDALKVAGPGDTVLIRGGKALAPIRITGSYQKAPLTVANFPDEEVLIDTLGIAQDGVVIAGDGITLKGITVTNIAADSNAIHIQTGSKATIEECHILAGAGNGILASATESTIERNFIHHLQGTGVVVSGDTTTVRHNAVYACGGGLEVHADSLVHHNMVFRNGGTGIAVDGPAQVLHNTVVSNGTGADVAPSSAAFVRNNVFAQSSGADLNCTSADLCDYNFIDNAPGATFHNVNGNPDFLSPLSVHADSDGDGVPDALNAAPDNATRRSLVASYFKLASDSALINRGFAISAPLTDYLGNAVTIYPDLGAIEFQFPGGGPGNPPPTATPNGGVPTNSPTPTPTSTPTATSTPTPTPTPIIVDELEVPHPDLSAPTNFSKSTEFLYTGDDPIQVGVIPGTMRPERVAVLRGQVLSTDMMPLAGVQVTVLNHPEFGYTLTRAGGSYDMAVNGGEALILHFQKQGFLSSQRRTVAPLRDFVVVDDVVLPTLDPQVTNIDLTTITELSAAQGGMVIDGDGVRQGTVVVRPGVTAQLKFPDGTTQPLTDLGIRITEYTVGENGPETMPGELPMYSGYTYAAELSVDEAIAAGASDVLFSEPLPYYVENFLNFPVGMNVPVGFYDKAKAVWIPSPNGRVIKVLDILSGLAVLDVTGSGDPATLQELEALHIDNPELERIATLYTPGTELWRVELEHFTPWDCNWPFGPPPDATKPNQRDPKNEDDQNPDDPCEEMGSIIECENSVLRESIAIPGTKLALNYSSSRAEGKKTGRTLNIPLSGSTVPSSLESIVLDIRVAGQAHHLEFPPQPDQSYVFEWDGRNGWGQVVQGAVLAEIDLGFQYQGYYYQPDEMPQAFALYSGLPISGVTGNLTRGEVTIWQKSSVPLINWKPRELFLGGWSLSAHHTYNVASRQLVMGDGTVRSRTGLVEEIVDTVAGTGVEGSSGDGGPAVEATLDWPFEAVADVEGNVYVATNQNQSIRKVDTSGIITRFAGTGVAGFSGDGGPAINAQFNSPVSIAIASDGSMYIADYFNHRVRRIGPDGIISTIFGNGLAQSSGDGGPAHLASTLTPRDLVIGSDGALYIAEDLGCRIRRIGTDNIVSTIAGTGAQINPEQCAIDLHFDEPATESAIGHVRSIALNEQGQILIANYTHQVLMVRPDGTLANFAGIGNFGFTGDGGLATQARLYYASAVIGPLSNGSVLIADRGNHRIRAVGNNGIITTYAGDGLPEPIQGSTADGIPLRRTHLNFISGMSAQPDGSILIADTWHNRIRRIRPAFPSFDPNLIAVPSEDGSDLYVFDQSGRHLRTLDTKLNRTVLEFDYTENGKLRTITDIDGNVVTINYSAGGDPDSIVAPFGQVTTLNVNPDGYLSEIRYPNDETYEFTYFDDGLLQTMDDRRGKRYTFAYDEAGRLISDQDPTEATQNLVRNEFTDGWSVTHISPMGRESVHTVEDLSNGDRWSTVQEPDGTDTTSVMSNDTTTTYFADGSNSALVEGPDPRFYMQSPIVKSLSTTISLVGTRQVSSTRSVTLATPNDPLSLTEMQETVTVNNRTWTTHYDNATRTYTTTTPLGRTTVAETDDKGKPIELTAPLFEPIRYTYDSHGRVHTVSQGEGINLRQALISYNPQGFVNAVTDALGHTATYEYDLVGRPLRQVLPGNREIVYEYDANGNVTAIGPPDRPFHHFQYSDVDLPLAYEAPLIAPENNVTTYQYDADRDLRSITRPDTQQIILDYSSSTGQLLTESYPQGVVTYGYSPSSGNITSVSGPDTTALTYTYYGSLPRLTTYSGEVNGSVLRNYDNFFRVSTLRVNSATPIDYSYDNDSLLTAAGALTLTRHPQHGLVTGTTIGSGGNEVTEGFLYTPFGEVERYEARRGGALIYEVDYQYDKISRIKQRTEAMFGNSDIYEYVYAPAGWLTEVKVNGIVVGSYTYDQNGNRIAANGISATYDDQDRLLQFGDAEFQYTVNGEIASRADSSGITDYFYDAHGTMTSVHLPTGTTVAYVLDGMGRRIGKKLNGSLQQGFLYQDGLNPIAELDSASAVVSRFVYGARAHVPDYMIKGGVTYRILSDHLGSVRLVINLSTGTTAQRIDYDVWGNITQDTNPGFQPFGFAGGIYDRDTGLTQFGVREYDSRIGRWTGKDPIGFAGGDTNLYGYVVQDPVNFKDPFGLEVEVCSRVANLPIARELGIPHKWIRTSTKEAGLGPIEGGVPGNDLNSPDRGQSSINDHTGEGNKTGSSCVAIPGVDEEKVNSLLPIGEKRGLWIPGINDCHGLVKDVLRDAGYKPPPPPRYPIRGFQSRPPVK